MIDATDRPVGSTNKGGTKSSSEGGNGTLEVMQKKDARGSVSAFRTEEHKEGLILKRGGLYLEEDVALAEEEVLEVILLTEARYSS